MYAARRGSWKGFETLHKRRPSFSSLMKVVTGFRLAYGGAQEYYGVTPDLAAFGKAMGGGYPIGAVCGRADIMDLCIEANLGQSDMWFASTLAESRFQAASLATLGRVAKPGAYQRLHALGKG
jgi:glutamate-1-semialdehyde 2,1-aminomutase